MKTFLEEGHEAISAKRAVGTSPEPPMERRVLTGGLAKRRVLVKFARATAVVSESSNLKVMLLGERKA